MAPSLSVIIPVYNVERFLSGCLDSIMVQSYKGFECIIVDDGSTDSSGTICDNYAAKDNRIRVIHKDNGGVCSARNRGLDEAKGEFIVFVDSDDYVTDHYLANLMENSDSDFVVTGFRKFGFNSESCSPTVPLHFNIIDLPYYWNTPPIMNYLYCFSVAKRFRASLIHRHGIRFNEDLFFSEDMVFNMEYLCHASTISEVPLIDYMYRIENISRDKKFRMSAEQLIPHYTSINNGLNILQDIAGGESLSFVRDNTNFRLMRKFYFFVMDCKNANVFINNIKLFREQDWSNYMLSLLKGRKEKRVLKNAVLFPRMTYIFEIQLHKLIRRLV